MKALRQTEARTHTWQGETLSNRMRFHEGLRRASACQGMSNALSSALRLVRRRRLARLFFEILFHDHVVTRLDSLSRRFHFLWVEDERGPIANHAHNKPVRRFRNYGREIVQLPDLFAVYLVYDAGAIRRQISVGRIGQNIRENHN